MSNTLYRFLKDYPNDIYPFHMPGHKRNPLFMPDDLAALDITEIGGADNLAAPTGVLAELNAKLANFFGGGDERIRAEFMPNGSTGGLHAALLYAAPDEGDRVVAARNSHKSVFAILTLTGAAVSYASPAVKDGFAGGIAAADINAGDGVKAVVVTSPTYEGAISDVAGISRAARDMGALLIADAAHGAHFPLSERFFPASAIRQGADIAVCSLHKTMPCLGQSAVVMWNAETVDSDRLRAIINMTRTSSPSYMMMAQTDFVMDKLINDAAITERFIERLERFRGMAARLGGVALLSNNDKSKIVLSFGGLSGKEAAITARDQYGIELECYGRNHVLALSTVADTDEGFERLYRFAAGLTSVKPAPRNAAAPSPPAAAMSLKAAFRANNESIALDNAVGRVSAAMITPYPPGIPLLLPGEVVSQHIAEAIKSFLGEDIDVLGITAKNGEYLLRVVS